MRNRDYKAIDREIEVLKSERKTLQGVQRVYVRQQLKDAFKDYDFTREEISAIFDELEFEAVQGNAPQPEQPRPKKSRQNNQFIVNGRLDEEALDREIRETLARKA